MANYTKWEINKWEGSTPFGLKEADYTENNLAWTEDCPNPVTVESFDSKEEAVKAFTKYKSEIIGRQEVIEYTLEETERDEDGDWVDSPGYDVAPYELFKFKCNGDFIRFLTPGYNFMEEIEDHNCMYSVCEDDVYSVEDFSGKVLDEYTVPEEDEEE